MDLPVEGPSVSLTISRKALGKGCRAADRSLINCATAPGWRGQICRRTNLPSPPWQGIRGHIRPASSACHPAWRHPAARL